jgi:hypothetical protein
MVTRKESVQTKLDPLAASQALTYTVYATREGLVGGTTANGHVIQPNDHFVALPSRRVLCPNGSQQYSVEVRNPATGQSEVAAVWDIGPWNEHDDYWNPSSQREAWQDLPQGTPEAQAAYQHGYNGGQDGSGRHVANPAGIDLADGTFAAIGMTDNGFVEVTFLWTGSGQSPYTVVAYQHANVRDTPHVSGNVLSHIEAGESYPAVCWTAGESITENDVTNDVWIKLPLNAGGFGYVSAVYLKGNEHAGLPADASC